MTDISGKYEWLEDRPQPDGSIELWGKKPHWRKGWLLQIFPAPRPVDLEKVKEDIERLYG